VRSVTVIDRHVIGYAASIAPGRWKRIRYQNKKPLFKKESIEYINYFIRQMTDYYQSFVLFRTHKKRSGSTAFN